MRSTGSTMLGRLIELLVGWMGGASSVAGAPVLLMDRAGQAWVGAALSSLT